MRQFFAICRVLRFMDFTAVWRFSFVSSSSQINSTWSDFRFGSSLRSPNPSCAHRNCVEKWFTLLDYEEFHKLIPKTLTIALLCPWEPNVLSLGSSDSLERISILTNVVGTYPVHRSLSGCLFVNLFGGLFRQDVRKMPHWKGDKKRYFEIEYD